VFSVSISVGHQPGQLCVGSAHIQRDGFVCVWGVACSCCTPEAVSTSRSTPSSASTNFARRSCRLFGTPCAV